MHSEHRGLETGTGEGNVGVSGEVDGEVASPETLAGWVSRGFDLPL
jgi:hypothetical protein